MKDDIDKQAKRVKAAEVGHVARRWGRADAAIHIEHTVRVGRASHPVGAMRATNVPPAMRDRRGMGDHRTHLQNCRMCSKPSSAWRRRASATRLNWQSACAPHRHAYLMQPRIWCMLASEYCLQDAGPCRQLCHGQGLMLWAADGGAIRVPFPAALRACANTKPKHKRLTSATVRRCTVLLITCPAQQETQQPQFQPPTDMKPALPHRFPTHSPTARTQDPDRPQPAPRLPRGGPTFLLEAPPTNRSATRRVHAPPIVRQHIERKGADLPQQRPSGRAGEELSQRPESHNPHPAPPTPRWWTRTRTRCWTRSRPPCTRCARVFVCVVVCVCVVA